MPKGIYIRTREHLIEMRKSRLGNKYPNRKKPIYFTKEHRQHISESLKGRISKPFSEEHKRKISESLKGKPLEEQSKNLIKYLVGNIPWNKGKTLSEETRKKISKKTKERMSNPEIRRKISETLKGKKLSKERSIKISKSLKGHPPWSKGKHWNYSEETRKKASERMSKQMKGNKFNLGKHHSEETRKKMRENSGIKGKHHSEETIEKIKEARAKQIFPVKDTPIEVKIQNYLKQLNIDFLTHQYIKDIEHGYQCDILIPSMNLVIECDGDYWHKYPIGREIDNIRTSELLEKGFKVLRLWECDIKNMELYNFQDKLLSL
jgi:very-short-patch-repair endonuclease